jgi:hypothetical protein
MKPRDRAESLRLHDQVARLRAEYARLRAQNRELRAALDAHASPSCTPADRPREMTAGTCENPRRSADMP